MTLAHFAMCLRAPLVATGAGTDITTVRSEMSISGAKLRGAFIAVASGHARDAAIGGHLRFLPAYPASRNYRSQPTPLTWRADRVTGQIIDLAATERSAMLDPSQPAPFPFVGGADGATAITLSRATELHIARSLDPRKGRPESEGIFTYEAIPAGTRFTFAIACDEAALLDEAIALLVDAPLAIGKSRNAQYGGAPTISHVENRERELEGRGDLHDGDVAKGAVVLAVLTSPALVRNSNGQIDPCALEQSLLDAFGRRATVRSRYIRPEVVVGHSNIARARLPRVSGACGGSVVVLEATEPIPLADLCTIERRGLGGRRADGFGSLAFLRPREEHAIFIEQPVEIRAVLPGGSPPSLVLNLQDQIVRGAVVRQALAWSSRTADATTNIPSRSLLGRLHEALRASPDDLQPLHRVLANLARRARNQLDASTVVGRTLQEWLADACTAGNVIQEARRGQSLRSASLVDAEPALPPDTSRIYVGALLQALTIRASQSES